jgi:hypothetical protein
MMRQSTDSRSAAPRSRAIYLMAIALYAFVVPAAPAFAQASGQVRVKFAKAGLLAGVGLGSGVLTYRGRDYPFRVSGTGFGFTAGASVGRFEGRASGIREVGDFAGKYRSVGAGGALLGGFGSVHLSNDKGVMIELQGTNVGMEFAANVSEVRISLK